MLEDLLGATAFQGFASAEQETLTHLRTRFSHWSARIVGRTPMRTGAFASDGRVRMPALKWDDVPAEGPEGGPAARR